jgi:hypothetical protein
MISLVRVGIDTILSHRRTRALTSANRGCSQGSDRSTTTAHTGYLPSMTSVQGAHASLAG